MQKHKFIVKFSDGEFWLEDSDACGPFDSKIYSWEGVNDLANGHVFGVQYRTGKQRKWRQSGCITHSIEAMLPIVQNLLKANDSVQVLTPDLVIDFYIP